MSNHARIASPHWSGRLLYYCFPFRKRIILNNIAQVFQNRLSKQETIKLAQAFYGHMLLSIKEMITMRFLSEKQLRERVDIKGHERLLAAAQEGKGVLILTGHFGNWEFAPIGGILNFKQFQGKFYFIRRTLANKMIERLVFRRYYQAGLRVIPKKNSLQQVIDVLAENNAVIFVMDQHAMIENRDGIAVPFFGKEAGTYRSLASFSRHTGLPVFPAASYRKPDGRHVLEFYDPIVWQDYGSTKESLYQNTLQYNQALEKLVLAHPEQWLWLHRRWKI